MRFKAKEYNYFLYPLLIGIMPEKIQVKIDDLTLKGELKDTGCAQSIYEKLPLESSFQKWGEEFYFDIGLDMELDDTARKEVSIGTIGYWPVGNALAIFFGPTPESEGMEPVAASEVNVVGTLNSAERLREVSAEKIRVEKG